MATPQIHRLERIYATGTGNMAQSITPGVYSDRDFFLLYARVGFAGGSAAGTADMTIGLDSAMGATYDKKLWYFPDVGRDFDVNFRVDLNDIYSWQFRQGESIVFTWTNPDTGNITWTIEAGLVPGERKT